MVASEDQGSEGAILPSKGQSLFNLLSEDQDDIEVVVGSDNEQQRGAFIPTNESGQDRPGFKLLTQEDLARESRAAKAAKAAQEEALDDVIVVEGKEAGKSLTKDIPRDNSGRNEAGFRLPLRDEEAEIRRQQPQEDRVEIIEVGNDDEGPGRAHAGFPANQDDDVIVVEAGEDEPQNWTDIPRDNSGKHQAGFRLPLPDEAEEDEYGDVEVSEASRNQDERLPKKIAEANSSKQSEIDPEQPDCHAPKDPGNCENAYNFYYFEPETNACHIFEYTGCGGNTNRQVQYEPQKNAQ